jgi:hypothetical protein
LRSHPTANPLLRQETFQIHYVSLPGVILAGISAFYKLRLRYVVAGIKAAIMFHRQPVTASFGKEA